MQESNCTVCNHRFYIDMNRPTALCKECDDSWRVLHPDKGLEERNRKLKLEVARLVKRRSSCILAAYRFIRVSNDLIDSNELAWAASNLRAAADALDMGEKL